MTETLPVVKPVSTARKECRLCGGSLQVVLQLGDQYLPRFVEKKNLSLPKAPLNLARCSTCGLLQLGDVIDPDLLYREFWYRSGMNATMKSALREIVHEGLVYQDGGNWLDIGANDGTLLAEVPDTFKKTSCEPARNFEEDLRAVSDTVVLDYFRPEHYPRPFNVITSAAMFYDLDDPDFFVTGISRVLSLDGVWINQLNEASVMLAKNAWDGICHEHQVYYDLPNLRALYARHGLEIIGLSTNDVNGGSIRVVAGHSGKYRTGDTLGFSTPTEEEVVHFSRRTFLWRHLFNRVVDILPRPVYGYGASTKGGTLLQYLLRDGFMEAIADRNPLKHGLVQSGVWTPIIGEEEMRERGPGSLLIMPWAFRTEFLQREEELRNKGTVMVMPLPNPEIVL
jgi:hypothetical protein